MGKKKKKNTSKNRTTNPKQAAAQPKKRPKLSLLAMIAGGALALSGAYFLIREKNHLPNPRNLQK